MMEEELLGAVLGLMLQHAQPMPLPYPPPMAQQQRVQQPQPPPSTENTRSYLVTHNGSMMIITVWPDSTIQIAYAQPKPELLAIGVRPGTLLVRGQWREDKTFAGLSHVYTYCGALPYAVTGRVNYEHGSLVLEGPAPRVWAGTCTVADYVWTANSRLTFERAPEQPYAQE